MPWLIPAWLVSALAILAAWALWLVRPMPRLIRISLIVPLVYFGGLYLWVQVLPFGSALRTDLISLGLLLIFLPIIANSILVRWQWHRERRGRAE